MNPVHLGDDEVAQGFFEAAPSAEAKEVEAAPASLDPEEPPRKHLKAQLTSRQVRARFVVAGCLVLCIGLLAASAPGFYERHLGDGGDGASSAEMSATASEPVMDNQSALTASSSERVVGAACAGAADSPGCEPANSQLGTTEPAAVPPAQSGAASGGSAEPGEAAVSGAAAAEEPELPTAMPADAKPSGEADAAGSASETSAPAPAPAVAPTAAPESKPTPKPRPAPKPQPAPRPTKPAFPSGI